MIAKSAGIESEPVPSADRPRRASSAEPTLATQRMAAPREIVVRSAPVRVPPKPAFSAAAAGASPLR